MLLLLTAARLPISTPDTAHRRKALDAAFGESISPRRRWCIRGTHTHRHTRHGRAKTPYAGAPTASSTAHLPANRAPNTRGARRRSARTGAVAAGVDGLPRWARTTVLIASVRPLHPRGVPEVDAIEQEHPRATGVGRQYRSA